MIGTQTASEGPVDDRATAKGKCRKTDSALSWWDTLIGKTLAIQHRLNPLHVYCRLLDKGLNRKWSFFIGRYYEILIFFWLNVAIKVLIHCFCSIKSDCGIPDQLRKV